MFTEHLWSSGLGHMTAALLLAVHVGLPDTSSITKQYHGNMFITYCFHGNSYSSIDVMII